MNCVDKMWTMSNSTQRGSPASQAFWRQIKEEVDNILESKFPLDPLLFLFGAAPEEMCCGDQRYILMIAYRLQRK